MFHNGTLGVARRVVNRHVLQYDDVVADNGSGALIFAVQNIVSVRIGQTLRPTERTFVCCGDECNEDSLDRYLVNRECSTNLPTRRGVPASRKTQ